MYKEEESTSMGHPKFLNNIVKMQVLIEHFSSADFDNMQCSVDKQPKVMM